MFTTETSIEFILLQRHLYHLKLQELAGIELKTPEQLQIKLSTLPIELSDPPKKCWNKSSTWFTWVFLWKFKFQATAETSIVFVFVTTGIGWIEP